MDIEKLQAERDMVALELAAVDGEIKRTTASIAKLEQAIDKVWGDKVPGWKQQLAVLCSREEQLHKEVEQLRRDKEQLRTKEELLLRAQLQGAFLIFLSCCRDFSDDGRFQ